MSYTERYAPSSGRRLIILAVVSAVLASIGLPPTAAVAQAGAAAIVGRVVDQGTGTPVANATVRLLEIGRSELSHADGSFHFHDLPPREYTVVAQRIGYAAAEARVDVPGDSTVDVVLPMAASALELSEVVVTGTGRARSAGEAFRPTTVIGDAELRRRLESSLAATIDHIPGISQRYNGPIAAQPVIRGLGGDRVLVLEDGQRTGDLATTAGDHAVTSDPFSAARVEVVRGPAGLMYGSNALGGVINVVREEVPRTIPERVTGTVGVLGETVSRGAGGSLSIVAPAGPLAVRGEFSGRTAGDVRTPLGPLPSSDFRSFSGALGASHVASWGFAGTSYRDQDLSYGVPGEFEGQPIPGADPEGARLSTRRQSARLEAEHFSGFGPFSSVAFDANLVRYRHRELEGHHHDEDGAEHEDDEDEPATRFENLFASANLLFRHEHATGGARNEGAFGFYASGRELRTDGLYTGTRDATSAALAAFLFEELAIGRVRLQIGGRYDRVRLDPKDTTPLQTGSGEVPVRRRTFAALSGSVAALVEPAPGLTAGVVVARAFRHPSVEELFSDGPHLADFTYDIGSPDLDAEIGLGTDVFLRFERDRLRGEITAYRNAISNYIHHAPTGALDPRFDRFPVFEARGRDALFVGGEASLQWEIVRRLVLDASAAVVRGSDRDTDEPIPGVPPLDGSIGLRYETDRFHVTAAWRAAARQDRVPDPVPSPTPGADPVRLETPTAGHSLFDVGAGIRWLVAGRLHSLSLQVDNVTDVVWRDHLARTKDVAPQPGRNVQLVYRAYF